MKKKIWGIDELIRNEKWEEAQLLVQSSEKIKKKDNEW